MLPTLSIPLKNFEPMEAYVAEIGGCAALPYGCERKTKKRLPQTCASWA